MKEFAADLHIHSCLSPCASEEMIPPNVINMAKLMGVNIISVCDHNCAKNVEAFIKASGKEILVIPGMEVQTMEEVHVLCYFRDINNMRVFENYIYRGIPDIKNIPELFGNQHIVDEKGDTVGIEERMLSLSVKYSINEIFRKVKDLGGLFVPAHIDRKSYSIISNLGFIPEDINPDALEVSKSALKERNLIDVPMDIIKIYSSDAHNLLGLAFPPNTFFIMEDLTIDEFFRCIKGEGGRRVVIRE
ncbi:PHP domain-containing protein [Thermovenabulum gondwanense]|uniref:Polymerase/histidinol phosphatase N-terminal domain-containing protein n=1 Tax=Thermovenabulum gondwanense TaxID=520767 RepID=A0A162MAL0_9FIRM|nr:hypothetical protein [Thermovenabulum gondwanense]KYO64800.1 hypothetical protein ATZ99_18580 [Thermovenabulum gondwanense]